ncbi:MAG: hypothetical protein DMG50_14520 [Acidobacteria bacterium]|nr:MAG: hypothetical protein DMG50_14520 [Acidobacteriota bacterium]
MLWRALGKATWREPRGFAADAEPMQVEAGKRDLFGDKANGNGPCQSTQSFLDGKSCFMRRQ